MIDVKPSGLHLSILLNESIRSSTQQIHRKEMREEDEIFHRRVKAKHLLGVGVEESSSSAEVKDHNIL